MTPPDRISPPKPRRAMAPKAARARSFERAFDRRIERRVLDRDARQALGVHNGSGFSRLDFWRKS